MSFISWNSCGLGNPLGIQTLSDLVRKQDPEFLFLQETRLNAKVMEKLKFRMGFYGCLAVSCEGRSGGIALYWKKQFKVEVQSFSKFHIHAKITEEGENSEPWWLTGFYGQPDVSRRHESWDLLRAIKVPSDKGWLIMGDFNEIMSNDEKSGGRLRPDRQMQVFREVIEECHLHDLGFEGNPFTWCNRREEGQTISERLDRFLSNFKWHSCYPMAKVTHGIVAYSDHVPIILRLSDRFQKLVVRRLFRFEAMWIEAPDCKQIIQRAWRGVNGRSELSTVIKKIQQCQEKLTVWNKSSFGHVQRSLRVAQEKLQLAHQIDPLSHDKQKLQKARNEVQKWLQRNEIMWRQRSKALWLAQGDKNSKFFHHKASQRKKKNWIQGIKNSNGEWKLNEERDKVIIEYFTNLFKAVDTSGNMEFLQGLTGRITPAMVELLDASFTQEEVKRALDEMHPTKAPGPDGMASIFYQHFWSDVGKDVTDAVLFSLNSGQFPADINHTFITLVPKKNKSELVSDYRPISLCNVIYKLISKVLANRLKRILPSIISPSQTAFVPGRLITDNVLVAYEMVHFLRRKRSGRDGFMSLKLDMSKAYDRIEWSFLEEVMKKMGFSEKWIRVVMFCVKSVTFSILVNGVPKGHIVPSRGLRQGDPISPYLFLLCTEGLISLLDQANTHQQIEGIRVCRGAPKLNHLLFADDSVIFCKANLQTCLTLQHRLDIYEQASGQKINREKTSMVFSHNLAASQRGEIMHFGGVQHYQQYDRYLGLPPMVGRGKYQAFSALKHRVWSKLQGWKEKLLSQGGKEVLLKAVALSISTYTMSCFKLPKSLCSELEGMMAKFWWGQRKEERKLCWVSWHKMCTPKLEGGMGFRSLQIFNQALLAKQGWRILSNENSLLHKVFKARYFPTSSFQNSSLGGSPSYVWRGIWEAKNSLLQGCRWRVGNGLSIKIWSDYWLPNHKLIPALSDLGPLREYPVAYLMQSDQRSWDFDKIRSLLPAQEAAEVLSIRIPDGNVTDTLVWEHEKSGIYSVKSAYTFFTNLVQNRQIAESSTAAEQKLIWKNIWNLHVPHRVKVFAWRVCKNILPTLRNLKGRKLIDDARCTWCQQEEEDVNHALVYCPLIIDCWLQLFPSLKTSTQKVDFLQLILYVITRKVEGELEKLFLMAWGFWYRRNQWMYEAIILSTDQVIEHSMSLYQEHKAAAEALKIGLRYRCRWKPPPSGVLKLNVDGALFSDQHRSGIGMVLRDDQGQVLFAASKPEEALADPMEIELIAMLRGLQLCIPLGISDLQIETDALLVVQELQKEDFSSTLWGSLIQEIKSLLNRRPSWKVQHKGREANGVAHSLARYAWNLNDIVIWWDSIPDCISQALWADLSL